nr:GFA family protein [Chelatococcus reniformis]
MEIDACHCGACRRWSAGPFMSVSCGDTLSIQDESQLRVFRSSDWAERISCTNCGGALFWRLTGGGFVAVAAFAFDDPSRFAFTEEIFVDEQPVSYAFANETHRMTGAEVVAAMQAKEGN